MALKNIIKRILPEKLFNRVIHLYESIPNKSIRAAMREQKLLPIYDQLIKIVPDITHQYSSFDIDTDYLRLATRAQHAFQISLVKEVLSLPEFSSGKPLTIVDIGDSAGTHIQYIKGLFQNLKIRSLSVNIDSAAVERIKKQGLEAICARAEDLTSHSVNADVFLSFEMLEHLMNPFTFLNNISQTSCKFLAVTVPYVMHSRVGLNHIRNNQKHKVSPENTHIFELSPEDWRLVFKHTGWAVVAEKIYYQYPKESFFSSWLMDYWQKHDFEGFYGVILKPDKTWSALYNGW
jgi:hypothetical protein